MIQIALEIFKAADEPNLRFLCSFVFQRFLFRTLVFARHIAVVVVFRTWFVFELALY
jgi:hypothetical protein